MSYSSDKSFFVQVGVYKVSKQASKPGQAGWVSPAEWAYKSYQKKAYFHIQRIFLDVSSHLHVEHMCDEQ